jgi:glycosyl transferase family 1
MRVLEISRLGLFKSLVPDDTDWIRWGSSLTANEPIQPEEPSFSVLARTLWRIGARKYDLIVLPAIHPQHVHNQSTYKLMSKAVMHRAAELPGLPAALHRLGLRSAQCVVVDVHDGQQLCETTLRLFPNIALYFKRELALSDAAEGQMAKKLRPVPLVLPDERRIPMPHEKDLDLVFAGALNSETRRRAVHEACRLAARGLRVFIPDKPLSYPAFMQVLARAWLVLSPEGEGWDCYRHYESCFAGSVPLINKPRYRRNLYLQEGVHCFYYDADRDCLATRATELIADKPRLARMAEQGRRHVLANHTRSAVARYMLNELGESARAA